MSQMPGWPKVSISSHVEGLLLTAMSVLVDSNSKTVCMFTYGQFAFLISFNSSFQEKSGQAPNLSAATSVLWSASWASRSSFFRRLAGQCVLHGVEWAL